MKNCEKSIFHSFRNQVYMTATIMINSNNFANYNYIIPYVRYLAEDKYQASWTLRNRKIFDYELILITKGTGQFTIEGRVYDVKANDLLLIKPNKWHRSNSVKLPFNFFCAHFDLYISDINGEQMLHEAISSKSLKFNKAVLDFPECVSINDSGYIQMLFRRLVNEYNQQYLGYNINIRLLFFEMLINLFRQGNESLGEKIFPSEISGVIDFIKQNYKTKISLTDLSNHVHLQATYLCSLFKKHTGHTITSFIKMFRISKAKDLLLGTELTIEEIASSTGFYDLHHFSKVFKLYEGLTPAQFRQIKR